MNMLRIDASARKVGSHSRNLGDTFEREWLERHPGTSIVRRDLAEHALPHISDLTIEGFYTPTEKFTAGLREATALSDTLIAELLAADVLLLTTPMYNFTVPSALKAWIDQIVRMGRTFSYDGKVFAGLVVGKPVYITCAYGAGGYHDGGPMGAFNMVQGYLRLVLGFLGFASIHFVEMEATTAGEDKVAEYRQQATLAAIEMVRGAK